MTKSSPKTAVNRRGKVLLQPVLQFKLAFYHLLLGGCFAATIVGVLHAEWIRLRSWLMLTEVRLLVDTTLARYATDALFWIGMATFVFLVCSVVITALTTHRMVGPTVAFRRHLQALTAGDYSARTYLRPHDAFQEVADELNKLSRALEMKSGAAPDPEPPAPPSSDSEPVEG